MHCACCDIAAHSDPKNVNKSRRPCSRATKKRERSDHGALLLLGKQALCSPCVSAASLKIYVRFKIRLIPRLRANGTVCAMAHAVYLKFHIPGFTSQQTSTSDLTRCFRLFLPFSCWILLLYKSAISRRENVQQK